MQRVQRARERAKPVGMRMALMPPASGERSALALGFGDAEYQLGYADAGAGAGEALI